jgi:hypothetical protein
MLKPVFKTNMIRKGTDEDFDNILNIINDAAIAYKGVIPEDRWHQPYMTQQEKNRLLEKYWAIPDREVETSIVLVDAKHKNSRDF